MTPPATAPLERTLGLGGGIALAIGSVAGSGILFLPSVTYRLAGPDALVVWVAAVLLCVPLLLVFSAMVREVPDGSGLEGFVARGLGPDAAACVPALILVTYYPGLAAASLVAGGYLETAVGGGQVVELVGALLVIGVTTAANLVGARAGARWQSTVMWLLLIAAVSLVALTVPEARGGYEAVRPVLSDLDPIVAGVLVGFWAFAGFENMTFIAGELRNPQRDYLVVTVIALVAYAALALLLTANLAAIVPRTEVDALLGIAQLADAVALPGVGVGAITVLALALVQANTGSWLWGTSRLLHAGAREGRLPAWLTPLDGRGVPRRAVLALALPGAALTCFAAAVPMVIVPFVVAASAVFLFLYLLALVSYLRTASGLLRRGGASVLTLVLLAIVASRGWYVALPMVVSAAAWMTSRAARRRRRSGRR